MDEQPKKKRKSRAKPKDQHKPTGRPRKEGPRDKMGRPTVLTAERKDLIVMLIASGNFLTTACAFAEVGVETVNAALRRGQSALSGPDHDFRVAVDKAHAQWTAQLVSATTAAALKNPEVALKMLGRRAKAWSEPKDVIVTHTGAVGSFDVAPAMATAVRSDPRANAQFHDLLARLQELGTFESGGPRDDREPRALQPAAAPAPVEL